MSNKLTSLFLITSTFFFLSGCFDVPGSSISKKESEEKIVAQNDFLAERKRDDESFAKALFLKSEEECKTLKDISLKERCLNDVLQGKAIEMKDVLICEKITGLENIKTCKLQVSMEKSLSDGPSVVSSGNKYGEKDQ